MALSVTASLLFALITAYSLISLLTTTLPPNTKPPPPTPSQPPLTLSPSHTFKLALFSDLHYGEQESSWGIDQDANSTRLLHHILSAENPDLAVLNGDLITGENTFRHNSSAYVHRIVAPMVDTQTPWASTYGNHDSKANLRREDMLRVERGYGALSYTRTTAGLEGITNYYLLIYRPGRRKGRPVGVLWFFDSRGGGSYGGGSGPADEEDDIPNWVGPGTARWFRDEASALRARYGGVLLPSVAFVHIPPTVFLAAQRRGIDPALFPGVNEDVPVAAQGTGREDGGFVDVLREERIRGGLHSVFVGHDHGNAWCALWPGDGEDETGGRGPFLCFGRHTGYGGYGDWTRGSRIVRLRFGDEKGDGSADEMEVETWVRMEGGQVVTRVMLNQTYGRDRYPTANGEFHE
ncbi:Metallo-dependent phosphatase [Coniochaeta ligniaria NRRL 30616]|uniref:Metallo-dependent phosphatase n=1 Tax=Coniochaeta ligniaria NRRL 30616 TaxID=1408157 RepID=A0A1J7J128_9PEZI|nr:Metallo-dependent phosphatase [Coniochaeta ligniaria NRRL 30616]